MEEFEKSSRHRGRRGNMILAIIFGMLITFVGFFVLTHTVTHVRIQRARSGIERDGNRLNRELILYLHQFRETVFAAEFSEFPEPELDYFNAERFPPVHRSRTMITNVFKHHIRTFARYRNTRFIDTVTAADTASPQAIRAEAVFDLCVGHIPLTQIPLVLNKDVGPDTETYLKANRIRVKGGGAPLVEETPAAFDVSQFLVDLLKISGGELNWRGLREKFGLESSDDPLDNGVYIVYEPPHVETVFIQGDVQQMVFSVENGYQIIRFNHMGTLFHLRYRPGDGDFSCWEDAIPRDAIFAEAIAVNGSVWSLSQEGEYAFCEESGITLYVAGDTVFHSSIEGQNMELKFLKLTQLTLVCGRNALPGGDLPDSRVSVEGGGEVTIQATILVDGALANRAERLNISGSLYAKDIDNPGEIDISAALPGKDPGEAFATSYLSRITRFLLRSFEEVYGEG